jgi:hypothetical protein
MACLLVEWYKNVDKMKWDAGRQNASNSSVSTRVVPGNRTMLLSARWYFYQGKRCQVPVGNALA